MSGRYAVVHVPILQQICHFKYFLLYICWFDVSTFQLCCSDFILLMKLKHFKLNTCLIALASSALGLLNDYELYKSTHSL